jgi:predicted DNA-binding transcriptional regulator AlpA
MSVVSGTPKAPVKFDDLPRGMRRHLGSSERTTSPATAERMTANKAPTTAISDRIIRLPELLVILQISRTTAYELQKKNILPHSVSITGGRAVGWKLSDIERFVASLGAEVRDV